MRWLSIKIRFLLLIDFAAICIALFLSLHLLFPLPMEKDYSAAVYDRDENLVHAYLTSDEKWRLKTSLTEISPLLKKTIVFKEDKYFYYHFGVNPFALCRALINNLFTGRRTSGASTITMQVARSMQPGKRTYANKLIEMFRSLQLEMCFSKDEILRRYLNHVPYGGNIEGVKSAAFLYFKKNPDHLSLAEITALSIIPNRPSSLVIGRNNELILTERNRWLRAFSRQGLFTTKEIADALDEPLQATRGKMPALAPHLSRKLRANGGEIHSFISQPIQSKVEKIVSDFSRSRRLESIMNAAVMVIDNHTHQVIAYIGSADFNDSLDAGQVDGVQAIRQPGSTLKPLVYALAIDHGKITPKSILEDVSLNYNGYSPENYDRSFAGAVPMDEALEHSLNVPAVRTLAATGLETFIGKLEATSFRQVAKDRNKLGLSLILGGCGATLQELTGLYSIFSNEGIYHAPIFTKAAIAPGSKRIISPAAAFMINDVLSKVNRPDFPLNWQSTEHMPKIAWKTGTSYGRRDAWSIGYNKKFTVGVWVGNFSGRGVSSLSGANTATPLLFRIFNTIDYDADREWFQQSADCSTRLVCAESGLPPADFCESIISDYFIPMVSSSTICEHLKLTFVSADEKVSYCRTCLPSNGYKKKYYRNLSSNLLRHNQENQGSQLQIPSHNPDCEKLFSEAGPVISFPLNGHEYLLSKRDPEPLQLKSNASADVSRLFWYINDRFYKASDANTSVYFLPEEGPLKISCTDDKGRNRTIRVNVRYVDL